MVSLRTNGVIALLEVWFFYIYALLCVFYCIEKRALARGNHKLHSFHDLAFYFELILTCNRLELAFWLDLESMAE